MRFLSGALRRIGFAAPLLGGVLLAQMLTNPVQDYVNKTQLLNNILSNSRAVDLSQKAQTGVPSKPAGAPAVSEPTAFTHSGAALLPRLLAAKAGPESESYFASLL